jgi:hypothetical protein
MTAGDVTNRGDVEEDRKRLFPDLEDDAPKPGQDRE